jgi:hypothetical protein
MVRADAALSASDPFDDAPRSPTTAPDPKVARDG